jgi:hypothetical protein
LKAFSDFQIISLLITTNSFSQLSSNTPSIHLSFNSGKYSAKSSAFSIPFIFTILAQSFNSVFNVSQFLDALANTSALFLSVEKLITS